MPLQIPKNHRKVIYPGIKESWFCKAGWYCCFVDISRQGMSQMLCFCSLCTSWARWCSGSWVELLEYILQKDTRSWFGGVKKWRIYHPLWSSDLVLNYSSVQMCSLLLVLYCFTSSLLTILSVTWLWCTVLPPSPFRFSYIDPALQGAGGVALGSVQCICAGFNPVHLVTKAMETAKGRLQDEAGHMEGGLI